MKTRIIIEVLFSLLLALLVYYISNQIILTAVVGILFIAYFLFAEFKIFKPLFIEVRKQNELNSFINSFILTLSVRDSLSSALEASTESSHGELLHELETLKEYAPKDALKMLKGYFSFPLYYMFLNIIDLYSEQGGDILDLSKLLLEENVRNEDEFVETKRLISKTIVDFVVLWIITTLVIVIARFALNSYFRTIYQNPIYIVGLAIYFLFFLISIHLLFMTIKGCFRKEMIISEEA